MPAIVEEPRLYSKTFGYSVLAIFFGLILLCSCVIPAEVGPDRTGKGMATTNCEACTMTLITRYDTITFDFPNPKKQLRFRYLSDSITPVKITVKPLTDQTFNVRIFDKDNIQVYFAPDIMAKAGSQNNYNYTFAFKKL